MQQQVALLAGLAYGGRVDEGKHLIGMGQQQPVVLGGVADLQREHITLFSDDSEQRTIPVFTRLQRPQEGVFVDGAVHAMDLSVVLCALHGQVPAQMLLALDAAKNRGGGRGRRGQLVRGSAGRRRLGGVVSRGRCI